MTYSFDTLLPLMVWDEPAFVTPRQLSRIHREASRLPQLSAWRVAQAFLDGIVRYPSASAATIRRCAEDAHEAEMRFREAVRAIIDRAESETVYLGSSADMRIAGSPPEVAP